MGPSPSPSPSVCTTLQMTCILKFDHQQPNAAKKSFKEIIWGQAGIKLRIGANCFRSLSGDHFCDEDGKRVGLKNGATGGGRFLHSSPPRNVENETSDFELLTH